MALYHYQMVSLSDDFSEAKPIRILRDTGSAQSILLQSTLPLSDSTYSGDNLLLKGVDTSLGSYPSASFTRFISHPVM